MEKYIQFLIFNLSIQQLYILFSTSNIKYVRIGKLRKKTIGNTLHISSKN